jgi:poly(A) polymerase
MSLFSSFFKKKYPVIVPQGGHSFLKKNIEYSVLDILNRLRRAGFQAHLVGGCVRDILLGKKPKDFDVVTDARPQQIKRQFRRCFLIGRRFRLAHVYISHDRFVEVATFRAAVDPVQAEEGFAANNVYGTIEEDAQRRDFTVNGLYYNSADGSLHDYSGGLEDLRKKVIRSIGDPFKRFREDPVRIIRAARFCAQLGFTVSKNDLRAAHECAPLIVQANAHRMLEELYKILRCGASAGTITTLDELKILGHWIPELATEKSRPALLARLAAVDRRRQAGEEVPVAVLLSALLYDLFEEAMGDRRGYQDAFVMLHQKFTELATRLRIPKREWDAVCNLVARQSSFTRPSDGAKSRGFEKRFARNAHFPNAFSFFGILAEATGKRSAEMGYWKQQAAEAPPRRAERHNAPHAAFGGNEPAPARGQEQAAGAPGGNRKRRRRPRRRKPAGPKPEGQAE